ncbi:beta-N-acetylhexosaminidase [Microbulbifer aggregans]|uniref:beta-N-acetylhexosaminidase n=1 Tax=Microbulbifer aggregans TaxID=1769779 RepID=UPI001CFCCDFA|nr:family 20 glycosylhydrolase [Microbulbifer aggregans]
MKVPSLTTLLLTLSCSALVPFNKATALESDTQQQAPLALMPYPQKSLRKSGDFDLTRDTQIRIVGDSTPLLDAAIERFQQRLYRQRSLTLPVGNAISATPGPEATEILIELPQFRASRALPKTLLELQREREKYQLHISPQKITLRAGEPLGILRGLHTLSQLVGSEAGPIQAVQIEDQPVYRWRGLMLDSVRHFLSIDTIKRQLDGMAAAKLNVFHWHLTDDQGWRLESPSYPRLHQVASGGDYYTRDQVREIVAYAAARGIVVVPEIDMPGHASAIAVAYPELMSAPGPYKPEDRWGVHTPLLNPANPQVLEFAETILTEVAELFPFEYIHIGGDEVNPEHWQNNPQIQTYMAEYQLSTPQDLHNHFNLQLAAILRRLNRRMIGWDEVLHPDLDKEVAVQSWRGPDALADTARAGHPAILSTGFYLDQPQYTAYHYRNRITPPDTPAHPRSEDDIQQQWAFEFPRKRGSAISGQLTLFSTGGKVTRGSITFSGKRSQPLMNISQHGPLTRFSSDTWMGPLSARLQLDGQQLSGNFLVGNAPYRVSGEFLKSANISNAPEVHGAKTAMTRAQRENILGGEAALWAEMVDEHNIDLRLWPRTFAVAERLWSGQIARDEDDLYQRMEAAEQWAASALPLQHRQQQQQALAQLLSSELVEAGLNLSAVLEPAHYYHRHHEKSAHATYSRRDPLNLLADSLPVESLALREFRNLGQSLTLNPKQNTDWKILQRSLLHLWRGAQAAEQILTALPQSQRGEDIQKIAELAILQSELSFEIVSRYSDQRPFSHDEEIAAREKLDRLKGMHHEIVFPAVPVLEQLCDLLQYSTTAPTKITKEESTDV